MQEAQARANAIQHAEAQARNAVPGVFAPGIDALYLGGTGSIKLWFFEGIDGMKAYRIAVVMPVSAVKQMAQALIGMIDNLEKQEAEQKKMIEEAAAKVGQIAEKLQ